MEIFFPNLSSFYFSILVFLYKKALFYKWIFCLQVVFNKKKIVLSYFRCFKEVLSLKTPYGQTFCQSICPSFVCLLVYLGFLILTLLSGGIPSPPTVMGQCWGTSQTGKHIFKRQNQISLKEQGDLVMLWIRKLLVKNCTECENYSNFLGH